MKPLLDSGYVTAGLITGLLTALLPLFGRTLHEWGTVSPLLIYYHIPFGIVCFIVAMAVVFKRRETIPCGCAGDMTHTHNPWIQIPVALLIAVTIYVLLSWSLSYL